LASPCPTHIQRRSVSSAEVPSLLLYMHPETPHDVPCPLETPATHGTSGNVGNMGSRQGGIKESTFSRSSQYFSAYRSSFRGVFPSLYKVSLNLRGTPSLPPNLYLASCTLLHSQRQATSPTFARSLVSHLPHLHQQGPSSPDLASPTQASSIRITVFASLAL
jgi:hypothetical protein